MCHSNIAPFMSALKPTNAPSRTKGSRAVGENVVGRELREADEAGSGHSPPLLKE